ncbi:protein of unknown function [Candidatus Nitrotoga arctica]|uniref:Transposase IS801/IS1294 domain-containing protein n=2 Tax=Candidatus Nitrotoga arctica TaxID=453162 RepID=A0ABN8AKT5_9PROT|nr:protein of unknown function [Candidatus Nitrotoga arctica]
MTYMADIEAAAIFPAAIFEERLARNKEGQVMLTLKTLYRDGTIHIVLSPLEFMQRLAALVPRPKFNLIRFHGVHAPNANLRNELFLAVRKKVMYPIRMTMCRNPRISCKSVGRVS